MAYFPANTVCHSFDPMSEYFRSDRDMRWRDATPSVGRFLPQWEESMIEQGLREQTIYQRLRVIELIDRKISGELTPGTLLDFCRKRDLSPGTRYQYHSICASFFCWAVSAGHAEVDPFVSGPRPSKPRYRARPAGTDDLRKVLSTAREPVRSWAILAIYAGLRCGEIARVSGRDLTPHTDGWLLRIPEGKGSKPGSVPAHSIIVDLLRDAVPGRIWETMTAQKVSQRANAEFRRIGARCRMHELRHAFATELYRQTRDVLTVQHALRHEQLETTARYIAFDYAAVSSAVNGLAFGASGVDA
jgi:integrase/recombinase XerC